jgi:hypothetical protein
VVSLGIFCRLLLARRDSRLVLVSNGAVGSKMSIVHCRVQRDRGCRPRILHVVLESELLDELEGIIVLVADDMVMDGTSGALDCRVRCEIVIQLKRVCHASLDERTKDRIIIAVPATTWGKAHVMALSAADNSELGGSVRIDGLEQLPHVCYFLIENKLVLAFAHSVAQVQHLLRNKAVVLRSSHPDHVAQSSINIVRSYDFHSLAVGFTLGSIAGELPID